MEQTMGIVNWLGATGTSLPCAGAVAVPKGPTAIARGEHLVRTVGLCTTCHGDASVPFHAPEEEK